MENFNIEKWIWTEEDYDRMGWHDATVRAVAFLPETYEFALDIDYVFKWISPQEDEKFFSFLVAPATLIFENVNDLMIDIEPFDDVQLQDIQRRDARKPKNVTYIHREIEWLWVIDSNVGEITLWSAGYRQYIRQKPSRTKEQKLPLDIRGGFSFFRGRIPAI